LFELNCLVLGHSANNIFPVEIQRTKTVGALRKAIKEEKQIMFQHVDADALELWAVAFPVDDSLEARLAELVAEEKLLAPVDKLLDIFSVVPEARSLHILVRSPPVGEFERCLSLHF
jgi:hypothetical protein